MARKVTAKNIVGLAFIAPVIVLIAIMAILCYALTYDKTTIGDAVLYLLIPVLAVPALILTILSLVFTSKGTTLKWLWSIPLAAVATSITLSVVLVNYQIDVYRSKSESYASWYATLDYLKDSTSSVLTLDHKDIQNPGNTVYNIMIEAPVHKAGKAYVMLMPRITWKDDYCSIKIAYSDIVCERTLTTKGTTNTYRMRYIIDSKYTDYLIKQLESSLFDVSI